MISSLSFDFSEDYRPLAARMRPRTLAEYIGQSHLFSEGKPLYRAILAGHAHSMILWGPPGTGKTTLAEIIAGHFNAEVERLSAVTSGVKEIREAIERAKINQQAGRRTLLFVDEVHRFNKSQQDAFSPYIENGTIIFIGATTENPSFEVNGALLSRSKVFVLKNLETSDIEQLLKRAISDPRGFGDERVNITDEMIHMIAEFANGDARSSLTTLEMVILNGDIKADGTIDITMESLEQCISKKSLLYDKNGEEHYNIISALHKSMRNSDADAAVYWLARMLEAGEDPLYVARRVTRFASEDVGLADPRAMEIAIAAYQACHFIGMPECSVHLTEAVIYMALAPKSNAMEVAYFAARDDAQEHMAEPVPMNIRNAPTSLMKDLGYGKGYRYAHDYEDKITSMQCLPDSLVGREYYKPTEQGAEVRFKERLNSIKEWKKSHK